MLHASGLRRPSCARGTVYAAAPVAEVANAEHHSGTASEAKAAVEAAKALEAVSVASAGNFWLLSFLRDLQATCSLRSQGLPAFESLQEERAFLQQL